MSEPVAEFSRRVPLDRIGSASISETIEATAEECAALAGRFGWIGIEALSAEMVVQERAGGVDVDGRLAAVALADHARPRRVMEFGIVVGVAGHRSLVRKDSGVRVLGSGSGCRWFSRLQASSAEWMIPFRQS